MKGWRRAACLAAVLAGWVPAAGAAPGDWFVGWAVGSADGERATILSTTNGGTEWTNQGEGQVAAVALGGVASVGSRVWVVGAADIGYASIYCSTNDGADWARQGDAGSLPDAELLKCWAVNSHRLTIIK